MGAEYCDRYVCLCVCPQTYFTNHTYKLHQIFVHVACGRVVGLLRRRCNVLRTSGCVDDVNGPYCAGNANRIEVQSDSPREGGTPNRRRSLASTIALLKRENGQAPINRLFHVQPEKNDGCFSKAFARWRQYYTSI